MLFLLCLHIITVSIVSTMTDMDVANSCTGSLDGGLVAEVVAEQEGSGGG